MSVIERLQLLRNIGQFDNVSLGPQLSLARMALIYGENGRGKTTLAAILRSLADGDPTSILERKRLGAVHDPHIVVEAGSRAHTFQNGAWSATVPEVAIFDDEFVGQNVCSGIEVGASHRQNLHELILGAQGVAFNAALQTSVARIEEHNRELRTYDHSIATGIRGPLSIDQFCALPAHDNIDQAIEEAERRHAAAQVADDVRRQPFFLPFELPLLDVGAIDELLQRDLPTLQNDAAEHIQQHLSRLGHDGETWVNEGMGKINGASEGHANKICPFCAQELTGSPVIRDYEAFFSRAYSELRTAVSSLVRTIEGMHGGQVPAAFERAIRIAVQTQEFWSRFTDVPSVELDTAAVARAWIAARVEVLRTLGAKHAAPLEKTNLSNETLEAIRQYEVWRQTVSELSNRLQANNTRIALVKEQAAAADMSTLVRDLERFRSIKVRYNEPHASRCEAYAREKATKAATESLREKARADLDNYRQNIFPAYEASINDYLARFNAAFAWLA